MEPRKNYDREQLRVLCSALMDYAAERDELAAQLPASANERSAVLRQRNVANFLLTHFLGVASE